MCYDEAIRPVCIFGWTASVLSLIAPRSVVQYKHNNNNEGNTMNIRTKMIAFSKKPAAIAEIEGWHTKNGKSVRVVKRNADGTFVSNLSARQIAQIF